MNSINFCYWLRGFLEVAEPNKITKEQIDIINRHLDLALIPVTGIKKTPYNTSVVPSLSGSLLDKNQYQQAFCNYGPEGSC